MAGAALRAPSTRRRSPGGRWGVGRCRTCLPAVRCALSTAEVKKYTTYLSSTIRINIRIHVKAQRAKDALPNFVRSLVRCFAHNLQS